MLRNQDNSVERELCWAAIKESILEANFACESPCLEMMVIRKNKKIMDLWSIWID
jgi:hypothetical protein